MLRSGPCCMGKYVCGYFSVGIEAILFDRGDDADDGDGLFGIEPEVFTDGIVVRPEALGEIPVDDDDLRGVQTVVVGEEAAPDQGDLHGAEIVCACGAEIDLQLLAWRRCVSP